MLSPKKKIPLSCGFGQHFGRKVSSHNWKCMYCDYKYQEIELYGGRKIKIGIDFGRIGKDQTVLVIGGGLGKSMISEFGRTHLDIATAALLQSKNMNIVEAMVKEANKHSLSKMTEHAIEQLTLPPPTTYDFKGIFPEMRENFIEPKNKFHSFSPTEKKKDRGKNNRKQKRRK